MITQEELDLIERYINGGLDESSSVAFETRLKNDAAFLKAYHDILDIQSAAKEIGREKLREKLKQIASEHILDESLRKSSEQIEKLKALNYQPKFNNPIESQIVVGVDIGTTKIAAIVGRKNDNGKIEIIGFGKAESVSAAPGVITNIQDTVQAITLAVKAASSKSNFETKTTCVGIAGQHIRSLQHRATRQRKNPTEKITQLDIDALILDMYKLPMPPGDAIIHVIPQEYILDNKKDIRNPIGMEGSRLEVNCHIITGHVKEARNIYKCVSGAGLEVTSLFLDSIASAEAVLSDDEKEAGVVLVDIGGGTTDIAIFQDGVMRHTAAIPFGGNVITEDIREGFNITHKQAELLKIKSGSALASEKSESDQVFISDLKGHDPKEISVNNLAQIIQARMEEIIEQVYYEIKNSGYEKKLIAGIVITGGGAQLRHMVQFIENITGLDTRIGFPNEHLAKVTDELKNPIYATSVGLVIKGFMEMENERKEKPSLQKIKGVFLDSITTRVHGEDNTKL